MKQIILINKFFQVRASIIIKFKTILEKNQDSSYSGCCRVVALGYSVSPLLKHLLENRVKEKLVDNFSYEYKDLIVDLPNRVVTFDMVKWKFPRDTIIHSQEGSIKRLKISGIPILSVLWGTDFHIDDILFDSLDLVNYITLVTTQRETPRVRVS